MRNLLSRTIVTVLLVAVGACSSDSPTAAPDPSVPSSEAASTVSGEAVCEALLPAIDGNRAGLEVYTDGVVLDELTDLVGGYTSDEAIIFGAGDPEGNCGYSFGDASIFLTLVDDGDGQRAVSSRWEVLEVPDHGAPPESDIDRFETTGLDQAVADGRSSGLLCAAENDAIGYEFLPLVDGTVVAVGCEFFAYQGTYQLLGWDGAALYELNVEQWGGDEVIFDSVILGFPVDDDGMLVNLEKARGPGDCGRYSTWTIDGLLLQLVEVREKECDDGDYVEPTEWPVVYQI